MPIYEYICNDCQNEFEELVMSKDETIFCPKCESKQVRKLMSAASFKSDGEFSSSTGSSCAGCTSGNCGSCH